MTKYFVKEIFYTVQGEGRWAGRPAVFLRFSRCNLWTGHEKDRHRAVCQFCDTDFVGGERYDSASSLVRSVVAQWPGATGRGKPMVVLTGGEPLLQVDQPLLRKLRDMNFYIAVETNGTLIAPPGIDWICVSPKAGAPLRQITGNELKLVYPQRGAEPELFQDLDFESFRLSPMDEGPERTLRNTEAALAYCLAHPQWSLSLQTHKILGVR